MPRIRTPVRPPDKKGRRVLGTFSYFCYSMTLPIYIFLYIEILAITMTFSRLHVLLFYRNQLFIVYHNYLYYSSILLNYECAYKLNLSAPISTYIFRLKIHPYSPRIFHTSLSGRCTNCGLIVMLPSGRGRVALANIAPSISI